MATPARYTPEQAAEAVAQYGSLRNAERHGYAFGPLRNAYRKAVEEGLAEQRTRADGVKQPEQPKPRVRVRAGSGHIEKMVDGRLRAPIPEHRDPPVYGVRRFILTSAQNNTHLFEPLWCNLVTLAGHYDAEILVSRFAYDVASYGRMSVKPGTAKADNDLWYAPQLTPYVADHRVELAPGLVWCGELNILPTAVRPLSGLQTYTGRKSGIIPHAKIAMESVPSGKHEPTKFNYTTGCVTLRNYIQKKAGQKAEFDHAYGALLVEVDADGDWFVRQLNADSAGTIHDLDVRVADGRATTGHGVEAITWGDVHEVTLPKDVFDTHWGEGGIKDALRPRYEFLHDLIDFRARNHHERGNPHRTFQRWVEGTASVEAEMERAASFLTRIKRDDCQTVVVDSNHNNAFDRWLREADYRTDPENALYFLEAQLAAYKALERRDRRFHTLEWAMRRCGVDGVRFLRCDDSFLVQGVECGMHGHLGPNGSRGTALAFAKMGRKSNIGHLHSAGIVDGVYVAGLAADLDQDYANGPSSWSRSHIINYPHGKRAIVTVWNGKWKATE